MNFRLALAALVVLGVQATLSASTTYGFGTITGNNPGEGISLAAEPTAYQTNTTAPFWTEAFTGGSGTSEQIVCIVALANTSNVCGDPGPGSSVSISIPTAPGNSGVVPTGNYLIDDGDPEWGAPVWTDMTGLTVGQGYSVSFYAATSEEDGNDKAYNDAWEVYVIPGASSGPYICPVCSTPVNPDPGDLADTTPVMINTGAESTPWVLESFTFIATNTSEVLEFVTDAVAQSAGSFMPPLLTLADVSLTAVPEPGTWVLTILGVGIVFAIARLRRRSSARG